MSMVSFSFARALKWLAVFIGALVVITLGIVVWAFNYFVEPQWSKFGTVKDEAMRAGLNSQKLPCGRR